MTTILKSKRNHHLNDLPCNGNTMRQTFNTRGECLSLLRHSIPALNAWAARLIATKFPGYAYGCMDDLTTESSFDLQAIWVIDVLGF